MGNRPFGPEFPESLKNSGVGGFIDLGKLKNKKNFFMDLALYRVLTKATDLGAPVCD